MTSMSATSSAASPATSLWERYQAHLVRYGDLGIWLDISRMRFGDAFFEAMTAKAEEAFSQMKELEAGAIANPDENRMVGHYWLRNPAMAPTAELHDEIDTTREAIRHFAADMHSGKINAGMRPVHRRAAHRHRRVRARPAVPLGGPGRHGRPHGDPFPGQHRPRRLRQDIRTKSAASPQRSPWSFQNPAAQRRPAMACSRRRRATKSAGPQLRQARRRRHRRGQRAGQSRRKGRLASPFPDVGLGRRPHFGNERRRPPPDGLARPRHRSIPRRRRRDGRQDPRRQGPRGERADGSRADVVFCRQRQGEKDMVILPVQGPPRPVFEVPPAARDGIARQGARPRRQGRPPGHRRLRQ